MYHEVKILNEIKTEFEHYTIESGTKRKLENESRFSFHLHTSIVANSATLRTGLSPRRRIFADNEQIASLTGAK